MFPIPNIEMGRRTECVDRRVCLTAMRLLRHSPTRYRRDPRRLPHFPHRLSPSRKLELFQDVVHVVLDGRHAEEKLTRDLFVGETTPDKL